VFYTVRAVRYLVSEERRVDFAGQVAGDGFTDNYLCGRGRIVGELVGDDAQRAKLLRCDVDFVYTGIRWVMSEPSAVQAAVASDVMTGIRKS